MHMCEPMRAKVAVNPVLFLCRFELTFSSPLFHNQTFHISPLAGYDIILRECVLYMIRGSLALDSYVLFLC